MVDRLRTGLLGTAAMLLGPALLAAQVEPPPSQPPPASPSPAIVAEADPVLRAWVAADSEDRVARSRGLGIVAAAEAVSLQWLGERLRAGDTSDAAAGKRLEQCATHALLAVIDERRNSGMVFRGQYDALAALGPFATRRMFELLLETPQWFPETSRVWLVPALADLQREPPPPPILLGIIDVIADVRLEPEDLRKELACLVWPWGRREFVETRVGVLREASAEGDAEDRVLALRELADLWYRVQQHNKAAATHATLAALATTGKLTLAPQDWYWGACYWSLSGRVDEGLAALQRCAELLDSPIDSSLRLPRVLFERDPDLERLRADPRFAAIVARAFGAAPPPPKGR